MVPSPETRTQRSSFDRLRWALAGALAIAMTILIVVSRYASAWHVCDATLTQQGKIAAPCHPFEIVDLAPGLLMIVLLLLPDVSEFVLPGLGSLKLRVADQQDRSEKIEE